MKICIVGTGSIGRRHVENLHTICAERGQPLTIHALRGTQSPIGDGIRGLIARECFSVPELDDSYDAVFVCNPTAMHYETLGELAGYSRFFFVEKPLFASSKCELAPLCLPAKNVYYVACPFRYSSAVIEAKKLAQREKIYSVRAIASSYLPDWRPGADYRRVYSAIKAQGGGVCLDLIHEWDYLIHIFGFPLDVCGFAGRFSELELDSEDLAVYAARYRDKLVEVHLDYFGREARRSLEIYTADGMTTFDLQNRRMLRHGEPPTDFDEQRNDMYLREIRHFLGIVDGTVPGENGLSHALRVMQVAELQFKNDGGSVL